MSVDPTAKLTRASLAVAVAKEADPSLQRALLAALVDSSDDAIVSKTLDGRILSWNAGAARLFGYTAEEVIGRPITVLIPAELHGEERQILEQLRRGERIDHFETIRVTKDGRRIPISLSISPVRNAQGQIVAASKIARDISERKQAEQLLRDSRAQLAVEANVLAKLNELTSRLWRCRDLRVGLDEILGAAIELLRADKGNVQLFDQQEGVLRIAAQRGFEQSFLDFFREVSAQDNSACGRALRSGERAIVEDIEDDDTPLEPLRPIARAAGFRAVVSTPLIGGDGILLGVLSTHFRAVLRPTDHELHWLDLFTHQASNFIQRCRMEQALLRSEEALREADRRKDESLALIAHELRNALAPVRYAMATMKQPGRTPDQQKHAEEIIGRQVAHMSRLLEDLLDVSRITRGALELKKTRTELTSVIAPAIEAARPIMDAKHQVFSLDLPEQPVRLEADPVRLAQVFSNLLLNAAKYTDEGGSIQLRALQEERNVVVSVRDTGIGISAEMMPRLFDLFSRDPSAVERSEGGLGVGLALVQGLVALHEGSVEARSDGINRGSEFVVHLPIGLLASELSELQEDENPPSSGLAPKGPRCR
jgi:PAS domain S-box-containing protein